MPTAVELDARERQALSLDQALGPFQISDDLAAPLGFRDARQLTQEAVRLEGAIRAGKPLTFEDWKRAVRAVHALMSPDDSEWQTVTGYEYEETAALLASANRKIDLAFGGTLLNPSPVRLPRT